MRTPYLGERRLWPNGEFGAPAHKSTVCKGLKSLHECSKYHIMNTPFLRPSSTFWLRYVSQIYKEADQKIQNHASAVHDEFVDLKQAFAHDERSKDLNLPIDDNGLLWDRAKFYTQLID